MPETATQAAGQETPPMPPQARDPAEVEPWGGEVRVRGGAAPPALRWLNYGLFAWAVVYLLVHPRLDEGQVFLWVAAALLATWAILRFISKRPPEI